MIESLDRMSLLPEVDRAKLDDLVLAAADADVTLLDQTRVAAVTQSKRLTLYASEWDQPLRCSRWLHSGVQNKPRLGQGGVDVTVVAGVETVDASPVEKTLLTLPCASAHAYVIHNALVGNDLRELIRHEKAAAARKGLQQTTMNGLPYWLVKP